MSFILDTSIVSGPTVVVVYLAAAVAVAVLMARRPSPTIPRARWAVLVLGATAAGAVVGAVTQWIVIDVANAFGAGLSMAARAWICLAFALVAALALGVRRARTRRKLASGVAIVLVLVATSMSVNIVFGQFVTVRAALGLSAYAGDTLPSIAAAPAGGRPSLASWNPPDDLPAKGTMASVTIPNTRSGFAARPAVVYLPPAALTAAPPALPVIMVLSGQPGSPDDPFVAGKMRAQLDAWAAAHDGLAPIVVSPDQLGKPSDNPMCVDSTPFGASSTYLTKDVPDWITSTLPALTDRDGWAIAGFSQGGTCSIQLGAGHPELFGTIVDISGEIVPSLGNPEKTISGGFDGDEAAYRAALPLSLLAARAPYSDTHAIFAVGENDQAFKPGQQQMAAAAQRAGMQAEYFESPGTAHDWYTGGYSLARAFTDLYDRWGLDRE